MNYKHSHSSFVSAYIFKKVLFSPQREGRGVPGQGQGRGPVGVCSGDSTLRLSQSHRENGGKFTITIAQMEQFVPLFFS